jgi:hypothetical protein
MGEGFGSEDYGEKYKPLISLYNTEKMPKKHYKCLPLRKDWMPKGSLHYPRLDTILMVEEAIRKSKDYPTKRQLWLSLRRKMMYQTFNLIMAYFEHFGMMVVKDRRIIWLWNPKRAEQLRKRPDLMISIVDGKAVWGVPKNGSKKKRDLIRK